MYVRLVECIEFFGPVDLDVGDVFARVGEVEVWVGVVVSGCHGGVEVVE